MPKKPGARSEKALVDELVNISKKVLVKMPKRERERRLKDLEKFIVKLKSKKTKGRRSRNA